MTAGNMAEIAGHFKEGATRAMDENLAFVDLCAAEGGLRQQALSLWSDAFPQAERRDSQSQIELMHSVRPFHAWAIKLHADFAGIFFWWDLGRFAFCEHFAISPPLRNCGLGEKALALCRGRIKKPFILEAEAPLSEMASRRLAFYERCSFLVLDRSYRQPPYRCKDAWLSMYLLGDHQIEGSELATIKNVIYENVYGISKCKAP